MGAVSFTGIDFFGTKLLSSSSSNKFFFWMFAGGGVAFFGY